VIERIFFFQSGSFATQIFSELLSLVLTIKNQTKRAY